MKKNILFVLLLISVSAFPQKKLADYGLTEFSEVKVVTSLSGIKENATRYGLKDASGKIVLPPSLMFISDKFEGGYALIYSAIFENMIGDKTYLNMMQSNTFDPLWGLIDSTGKLAVETKFADIILLPFIENTVVVTQNELKNFNLLTKQGKLLSDEYTTGAPVSRDCKHFVVISNKKKGLVNRKGEYVLKPEYDNIYYDDYNQEKPVLLTKSKKEGCYSLKEKRMVIPIAYDNVNMYINYPPFVEVTNAGKVGLYDTKANKQVLPCAFTGKIIPEFDDWESSNPKVIYYTVGGDNTQGMIDNTGKVLLSQMYLEILPTSTTSKSVLGYMKYIDRKIDSFAMGYFYYNIALKTFKKSQLYKLVDMSDGYSNCLVQAKNNKWGLINCLTDKYLITPSFDEIKNIGYVGWSEFIAKKNDQIALYDIKGKAIIPFGKYTNIYSPDNYTPLYLILSKDKQIALCDLTGRIILPMGMYDGIELPATSYETDGYEKPADSYYFNVKKDNKWGSVDSAGQVRVPLLYDRIVEYADTMWASKEGKWGCIGKGMNQIVDFKFDTAVYRDFKFNSKGLTCYKSGQEIQLSGNGNEIPARKTAPGKAGNSVTQPTNSSSVNSAAPKDKAQELYYAIYNNDMEKFRQLMKNKPDLTTVYDNKPPVYHVALWGHTTSHWQTFTEMLSLLIKAGADPNKRGFFGETPLMAYFSSNYNVKIEFVKQLLQAGCDVNLKDSNGDDVFDKLKYSNASSDVKSLLKQYKK